MLRAAVVEWEGVRNSEVEFGRTDKAKPILVSGTIDSRDTYMSLLSMAVPG